MKPVTPLLHALLIAVFFVFGPPLETSAARNAAESSAVEPGPAEYASAAIREPNDGFDPPSVENEIARTDRLLERIRKRAPESAPPRLRRAYESAVETQESAKRHFDRGEYGRALDLTRQARRLAARLAQSTLQVFDPENVARALRFTERLIEEARQSARRRGADPPEREIGKAEVLHAKARKQFARGNYGDAYRLSLEARDVLKEALGARRPEFGDTRVRAELVKTDEEIRRMRDVVAEGSVQAARDAFDHAVVEQDAAWEEFEAQRLFAALTHTRIARNLLRQALDEQD